MGVSGCGKSAVGKRLAIEAGVDYIEGDDAHSVSNIEKMAAGVTLNDADRFDWLMILQSKIRRAKVQGAGLVLSCSALKRKYRDLLREANPDIEFIHLNGDRDVIASRLAARHDHFMPLSLLDSQFADLEPLQSDEKGVTLDIRKTPERLVELILAAIK
jgi:carbohydrate kinase (thermoresistant glucokinase family)